MAEHLISEMQVPEADDTLIFKDKEARNDLSTAIVETTSSNPLTFTTRSAQNAQSAEITLEPIQDLHGYDHPWPAGGGKNKLPLTISKLKEVNTSGTWTGNVYAKNGVTFSVLTDNGGNVVGVNVNGTASSTATLTLGELDIPNGTYYANGVPSGAAIDTYSSLYTIYNGATWVDSYCLGTSTFTVTNDKIKAYICRVNTGATVTNQVFYPMVRLSTETDPTFAPYSNICPITGHTEVSLAGCGKNLFDKDNSSQILTAYINNDTIISLNAARTIFVPCEENTTYTVSKVFSKRFSVGYTTQLPSTNVHVYGVITNYEATSISITTGNNAKYLVAFVYNSNADTVTLDDILNSLQLELGSTATEYEPYTPSNDLTKDLGIEVPGGSYNPVSGELVVTIAEVDLGTLEWDKDTISNYTFFSGPSWTSKHDNVSCSDYLAVNKGRGDLNNGEIGLWNTVGAFRPVIRDDTKADYTVEQFKTAMSGVQLCYELATPITYHLTPDEIKLLSGVNTIWTDGTSIKVSYRDGKVATLADLQDTANNLQEQIDQNETMEDETTQLLYKLGVNNGLLFIEEV